MNKFVYFFFCVLCGSSLAAQDPFNASKQTSFPDRIEILPDSNTFTKVSIHKDGKSSSYKFQHKDFYRYKYTDTNSVFGNLTFMNLQDSADVAFLFDLCWLAKTDAHTYYKMYKAPVAGTFALSALVSPIGLALAFPAAKTTPKIENLGMPNLDLLQDRIYYQTYSQEARKIKAKKVWTSFGIGLGINLGILFGILSFIN